MDIGGGSTDDVIEETEDIPLNEVSSFPVHDPQRIMGFAFQREDLQTIASKGRLSHSDKQLQSLDRAYAVMLAQNFTKQNVGSNLWGMSLREKHGDMMALQTRSIALSLPLPHYQCNRSFAGLSSPLARSQAGHGFSPRLPPAGLLLAVVLAAPRPEIGRRFAAR